MKVNRTVELLTANEERQLARAIEVGVLAEHLLATGERPVSASEEELRTLAAEGRRAWQRFLLANLRLVWKLAGAEARRTGLGVEELFQEGCVALAGALQRFDADRGKFSTYATARIGQHLVTTGAGRFGELALPPSRAVWLRRARGLQSQLGQERGRQIEAAELAHELQRPIEWTRRLLAHQQPMSIESCQGARQLADPGTTDPEWRVFCGQLTRLLGQMPADQREVLSLRYGLAGTEPASLAAVAQQLSTSPSTVRRLEQRALAKMRTMIAACSTQDAPLAG